VAHSSNKMALKASLQLYFKYSQIRIRSVCLLCALITVFKRTVVRFITSHCMIVNFSRLVNRVASHQNVFVWSSDVVRWARWKQNRVTIGRCRWFMYILAYVMLDTDSSLVETRLGFTLCQPFSISSVSTWQFKLHWIKCWCQIILAGLLSITSC